MKSATVKFECLFIFKQLKKSYPNRFMEVRYDDLLLNTDDNVRKMFAFCTKKRNENAMENLDLICRSSV